MAPGDDDPVRERDLHLHEKRTRFSLSHDQDSIGKLSISFSLKHLIIIIGPTEIFYLSRLVFT